MQTQDKNILKTVLIIIACMITILLLFLNKITTARYLSDIELKINGLVLLDEPPLINLVENKQEWTLVANTEKQKQILDELQQSFRKSVKESTNIVLAPIALQSQLNKQLPDYPSVIGVINKDKRLVAYFKPPFDDHKMLLTYSSVVTHRD